MTYSHTGSLLLGDFDLCSGRLDDFGKKKEETIHAVFQTIHVNMFDFGTDLLVLGVFNS